MAKPETIEAFYAIADANNWVLGEALQKAVDCLRSNIPKKENHRRFHGYSFH
ncbi:hypothetical protein ACU8MP_29525 (plasmid) [Rhizobium leguminosarum]